jgi:hypothetical protein
MKTHYLRWESGKGIACTYCNWRGVHTKDKPDTYRAIVDNPNTLIIITDKLEDVDCLTCIKRA